MDNIHKEVNYLSSNSYEVLNRLTSKTRNIWFVLHGMGYLSRFFLKHFDELPPDENYIIAPQAPSKYYLNHSFKHIGASWLTKEDTLRETKNVLTYLDAVRENEQLPESCNLILFGFSQGVSIATRWIAQRKFKCHKLILYAGGLPKELKPEDFDFLITNKTEVLTIVGDSDQYLTPERLKEETERINKVFKGRARHISFEGGHEIKKEIIKNLDDDE
ncbi:alpha/beta hydrolase [Maribacter sp. 2304DJ31-5]|uniref:alpha/beta hydrolase n=1 Tax=Maribacter sp. 2304DJ31-5 TaxID=3386273 RepID=UPI0039BCDA43